MYLLRLMHVQTFVVLKDENLCSSDIDIDTRRTLKRKFLKFGGHNELGTL